MPELPDVTVYVEALRSRILGERLEAVRISSPFVLRSVEPPIETAHGRRVREIRRMGKRIVLALALGDALPDSEEWLFLVIHLMIAGRLHWKAAGARIPGKVGLAALDFLPGTLTLTEAAKMKRASIQLVLGEAALEAFDPGGIEPLETDLETFAANLTLENHTMKRVLTDPTLFSGIGNAYSDEILHAARLSPILLTSRITEEEIARLYKAVVDTLTRWTVRLRAEAASTGFPEKVTAFRPDMAVHGRYGKPCPDCGATVQRIVYAENETNYCPRCQTGGRILADRALSRLLKGDWPRSIDEMEARGAGSIRPKPRSPS
jgi:formamidopyrimidine-DNA glycosylase